MYPISAARLIHRAALIRSLDEDCKTPKSIKTFCPKYCDKSDNHCAHYISHVLQLRLPGALLCSAVIDHSKYSSKERSDGYNIRVNEVFNACTNRAKWDNDKKEEMCIVVATVAAAIEAWEPPSLTTHPRKHIGIYYSNLVYNYSNRHQSPKKPTIGDFKKHYGRHDTILLRADLPGLLST